MRTLVFAACVSAAIASAGTPSARTIVARSVAANQYDFKAAPKYSYFTQEVKEDMDSEGHVKSRTVRTYEVLMIDGSPYRRLAAVDGRPLPPAEQQSEQKKLQDAVRKRRSESSDDREQRIAKYQADRKRDQTMMDQLTKAMNFTLDGETVLNGHPVWVLDATPRPDYHPPNSEAKVLTGMKGRMWIDKQNFQWVKVEAEVVEPVSIAGFLAKVQPGTRFELMKTPVGNGVWLPSYFSMRAGYTTLFFFSHNNAEQDTFYGYKPVTAFETASR